MFVLFARLCHTYRRYSYTIQVDESFHTHMTTTPSSQGVYFSFYNYTIKNKPHGKIDSTNWSIKILLT